MNIKFAKSWIFFSFFSLVFFSYANVIQAEMRDYGNWGGLYNSFCGTTATTYGDYFGAGPGNWSDGGRIATGAGDYYTDASGARQKCPDGYWNAINRYINIGTPIMLNDIERIDMITDNSGKSGTHTFYISQDGSTWYQLGSGIANKNYYYDRSYFGQLPITYIKYLRTNASNYTDYFHTWIHYNEDVTPPTSSGFQGNYSNATTGPFRVHMYNLNDDSSGVNRVEYWSRKIRLDGVDEGWVHHGAGIPWNDGSGGIDSYFDIPNRGEGSYEVHARVYDNKGNVAGPWGMWVYIDQTSPSTGVADYGDGAVRYTNASNGSTVRFHIKEARDNLSGVQNVRFWSLIEEYELATFAWSHEAAGINYYNNEAFYYDMPIRGEGTYLVRAHAIDYAGNGHGQNGWAQLVDMKVVVDRTNPTATSVTTSGRWLNSTTFRVEAYGVSDNLAGIEKVVFPTWTANNGQDDLEPSWPTHTDYQGIHAGGGTWYVDIPIDKHNNEEGVYITHIYGWDKAGNQGYLGAVDTTIDLTKPSPVSHSIAGATYVNGNDYWVEPGRTIMTKMRAKDELSGMRGIIQVFTGTNGTPGHSWIYYDIRDNAHDGGLSGDVDAFTMNSYVETYDDGKEGETTLSLTIKPTTSVKHYNFRYSISDIASNSVADTNTGKRINVDGEKPIALITQNIVPITKEDVVLTVTGSDGNGSGIKRIKLPDGRYVLNSVATYAISANGTYAFEVEDNVGNVTTKSITISTIDKVAPTITFTPEERAADFADINVQIQLADEGVSGYKHVRFVWTTDENYPTEGWSEWEANANPMIPQSAVGKWYLHIEAEDYAGNVAYAYSGIYEKIMINGGPSINLNVYPIPTGNWINKPMDVYILENGDSELLAKATKRYEITNSSLYPTNFDKAIPLDKKVQLNLVGENFIHVQYILDDGTKISSTTGPYLIDTGTLGEFDVKLTDASGNNVNDWSKEAVKLVISDPTITSVSGIQKQYRIEGLHAEWQSYQEGMTINIEGKHRIFGRIMNATGHASEQKMVVSMIDYTAPKIKQLLLSANENGTYDVSVQTTDGLSGVKEVVLDDGLIVKGSENTYSLQHLLTKPTSITIADQAGNILPGVAFEAEPVMEFQSPYVLNAPVYRGDVVVKISGANHYLVGWKKYACLEDTCELTIQKNTTITAIKENGVKTTKKAMTIHNLDTSTLSFVLHGKRNIVDPTKLEFEWNYSLTSGRLICTENNVQTPYSVTGTTHSFVGKNSIYECFVEGVYGTENIQSNKVRLFTDSSSPVDGETAIEKIPKAFNIHIDENSTGDAYMINTNSNNYKKDAFPFPKGLFGF